MLVPIVGSRDVDITVCGREGGTGKLGPMTDPISSLVPCGYAIPWLLTL